jgi:TrmH family RNA methyltransferase
LVGQAAITRIATTRTPQDILAAVRIPERGDLDLAALDKIIIADRIKDPGNMGTIIRTAKAFGFNMVMTSAGSVDIYNPKVIRSTQGAIFGIKMLAELNGTSIIQKLKPSHTFYSLTTDGDMQIDSIRPAKKSALIVGTEIEGVSSYFLDNSHFKIRIPQSGDVDSLNAAVAAGIAMFVFSSKSKVDLS